MAEPDEPCEPATAVEVDDAPPTPAAIPRVAAIAGAAVNARAAAAIRNFFMVFSCCNGGTVRPLIHPTSIKGIFE
jgi:hypothetical protein